MLFVYVPVIDMLGLQKPSSKEAAMRAELWGTFSVRDHLRPRSFIAEVLLYDRLSNFSKVC